MANDDLHIALADRLCYASGHVSDLSHHASCKDPRQSKVRTLQRHVKQQRTLLAALTASLVPSLLGHDIHLSPPSLCPVLSILPCLLALTTCTWLVAQSDRVALHIISFLPLLYYQSPLVRYRILHLLQTTSLIVLFTYVIPGYSEHWGQWASS